MKKKISSSLLIAGICLLALIGFVHNVNATDPLAPLTEQATLTITGIDTGDILSAYKVLNAYRNDETNEISYDFTDSFKAFLQQSPTYSNLTIDEYYKLTSGDITSGSTKTTSTLDTLASAYASYVRRNNITGMDMTTENQTATIQAEVGTYLVLPKTTKRVYAVMVGNLDYKEQDGSWVKNNATITAKVSDASITKKVGTQTESSAVVGKEITYSIKGTVPAYPTNATNKTYIIKDTLSNGLTHSGIENVVIKDGEITLTTNADGQVVNDQGNQVATINLTGQVMTITFDVTYITATMVTVDYKAALNENAVLGSTGNGNDAVLTYATDPYAEGTYTTDSDPTTATVYTYGLKVLKYQEGDTTKKGLAGAEFELYEDSGLTKKITTLTTDEAGYATYKALGEGTYYLKETKAPAGYTLIKNAVEIEINKDNVETTGTDEGYRIVELTNKKAGILPFTGGIGTIIYTVVGLTIVGFAATGIVTYRKKVRKITI